MKLTFNNLIQEIRKEFMKIPEHRDQKKVSIPLCDHLMSALGIFAFKYPSLLQYDKNIVKSNSSESINFKNLLGINKAPDDTNMRQTLDQINPEELQSIFKVLINMLHKQKALDKYLFHGTYLVAIDGTGFFESKTINCENCCEKHHRDGTVSYYHQKLCAVIIHPELKEVIPIGIEPIQKQDGNSKNDCERNACKRLLKRISEDFSSMKFTVLEDALSSNLPHIEELEKYNMNYILRVKKGNNKNFFKEIEELESEMETVTSIKFNKNQEVHDYKYKNNVQLKGHNVNYLKISVSKPNKTTTFEYITNIELTDDNIIEIGSGGRGRWKIENETFNTLKNNGYHFEHNFGHGHKYLSSVFAILMFIAFAIDQISSMKCDVYKKAKKASGINSVLWERMRAVFWFVPCDNWDVLFEIISGDLKVIFCNESNTS